MAASTRFSQPEEGTYWFEHFPAIIKDLFPIQINAQVPFSIVCTAMTKLLHEMGQIGGME